MLSMLYMVAISNAAVGTPDTKVLELKMPGVRPNKVLVGFPLWTVLLGIINGVPVLDTLTFTLWRCRGDGSFSFCYLQV